MKDESNVVNTSDVRDILELLVKRDSWYKKATYIIIGIIYTTDFLI